MLKQAEDATELDYPKPATGWLTVAILFVLYILSLTDRYIIALMVDPIKKDLGLSDFQISLLQGPAFALLFAICAIPVGLALDRWSRRWVLYISITVWSISAALCGLANSFATLFFARAGVGAGESGFGTGAYSIIGDSFPPHKVSLAMSVFVMGGVMGAGIVFLLGGPLVAAIMKAGPATWPILGTLEPWQQIFILTGLPGIALAFLVFVFKEPKRRAKAPVAGQAEGQVAGQVPGYGEAIGFVRSNARLFTAILLGFGMTYAVTIGFQLWTPTFLARVHGWQPARIGVTLGTTQILAAATLPLHGLIVDKLFKSGRRDAQLFWCMLTVGLAVPLGISAFLVSDPMVTIILYGLFTACVMSAASMGPAVTQVVSPQALRGRVSAIYVLLTGLIAMAGGPALVGLITDKVLGDEMRVGHSLIITVLFVLIPAVLLFAWGRAGLRRRMDEAAAG